MAKEALKQRISKEQNEHCAMTGMELPLETRLFDTNRLRPKAQGGIYIDENTEVVLPVPHMEHHSNLRIREMALEELKAAVDDREQIMKLRNKIANQILAYNRRTDYLNPATLQWLEEKHKEIDFVLTEKGKIILKKLKAVKDPFIDIALKVKGIGPMTVAYCLVYIDLAKADHASSLWAYTGLDKPSYERYTKGIAGGGNKKLRTALYTMADSQMKTGGAYRPVYDRVKMRLANSSKETKTRNTQGQLVTAQWKNTKPSHRHGAALRAVMKHFLADYWFVGRTLLGLSTSPLYVEAVLGNGHKTISPRKRGWEF